MKEFFLIVFLMLLLTPAAFLLRDERPRYEKQIRESYESYRYAVYDLTWAVQLYEPRKTAPIPTSYILRVFDLRTEDVNEIISHSAYVKDFSDCIIQNPKTEAVIIRAVNVKRYEREFTASIMAYNKEVKARNQRKHILYSIGFPTRFDVPLEDPFKVAEKRKEKALKEFYSSFSTDNVDKKEKKHCRF